MYLLNYQRLRSKVVVAHVLAQLPAARSNKPELRQQVDISYLNNPTANQN
jgi:hypothetical protein